MKPTQAGILTRTYRRFGREHLGIAMPVMASLGHASAVVSESELWDTVGAELRGVSLDAALPKPHPEFVVSGHAYGKYGDASRVCRIGVRFAGIDKALLVFGERHWNGDTPSATQPFESVPVDWPFAYGGEGYADNPSGIGFPQRDDGSSLPPRLPHIEYPSHRMRSRHDHVPAASFAPVASSRPQRMARYGTPDSQWLDDDCPGFPRTMDPRYFNVAPDDQQLLEIDALPVAAAYEIRHMHPDHATLSGRLPPLLARCFVKRTCDDGLTPVPMRLTTAWFIPHRERVVMIFHGALEIEAFDAHDVECILLAAEPADAPREDTHYQQVHACRSDPKYGALHALRDDDLMPQALVAVNKDGEPVVTQADALQRALARRARRHADEAKTRGVDFGSFYAVPREPLRRDELASFVLEREEQANAQRVALENLRHRAETEHPAALSREKAARRGPPRLNADGNVAAGVVNAVATRVNLDIDQKLRDAYRLTAQCQDAAPPLDVAESRRLRARLEAGLARGESFAGFDLTGTDLSRMNLRGAQLAGALLESANLTDTDLTGAHLRDALLARATLEGSRFDGADLTGANLSLARCHNADFTAATLDRCLFEGTAFRACHFLRASIHHAQFRECRFDTVDFSGASLAGLTFSAQTFHDLVFHGATLRKLAFVECRFTRVDFGQADIEGFACVETTADNIRFTRASLRKACFVKNSRLVHADFTEATLGEVNFRHTHAPGASFRESRVGVCDFSDAVMPRSDWRHANVTDTQLIRTDLTDADLRCADLIGAQMRCALLAGADFREANLFRANLAETLSNADTRFDDAYLEQTTWRPLRAIDRTDPGRCAMPRNPSSGCVA
ncbi:DUF2169 domain-containing protein [Paraburkholderia sp.]|uniref:DUF2169 family type VI secretion system accessory protein n=1 Tax=Paraburkholderia sp. TaxID=1926495 RepID=UPI002387B6A4|nr:DUF2169 domain-containing protein [Paraburkholderia sp.]MDE1183228.1 DUF2169 domain-containing protein [Paraburkholderia sp.]